MDPKRTVRPSQAGQAGPAAPSGRTGPADRLRPGAAAAPAGAAPGRRVQQEEIDQVAREVQQLRIDIERFFSGALPLPPEELRNRLQAQLRQLRNRNVSSVADSFRLGELEARFNSYNELFNRRLRDLEEGRRAARPAAPPPPPRFDVEKGVVVRDKVDPEAAEALYTGLRASPGEGPKFDLDSFQSYLERQAAAIRQKTGCAQVQFRLAQEDGKMKLKARPVPV
jgi:hypothetical protein